MLRTSNVDEINQLTHIPNHIKRRMQRECRELETKYQITVECKIDSELLVTLTQKENTYCFQICRNYPFKAPKMHINGLTHHQFFDFTSKRFRNMLKIITGFDCLCCNSMLCDGNWSPSFTIGHIIRQINEYKSIKRLICLKPILDKIKQKYFIKDIDLESWF